MEIHPFSLFSTFAVNQPDCVLDTAAHHHHNHQHPHQHAFFQVADFQPSLHGQQQVNEFLPFTLINPLFTFSSRTTPFPPWTWTAVRTCSLPTAGERAGRATPTTAKRRPLANGRRSSTKPTDSSLTFVERQYQAVKEVEQSPIRGGTIALFQIYDEGLIHFLLTKR